MMPLGQSTAPSQRLRKLNDLALNPAAFLGTAWFGSVTGHEASGISGAAEDGELLVAWGDADPPRHPPATNAKPTTMEEWRKLTLV